MGYKGRFGAAGEKEIDKEDPFVKPKACSMEDCTRSTYKFGLCELHYKKTELNDQQKDTDVSSS